MIGCTIPNTPLWNDRGEAAFVRMPGEMITKALVMGSIESIISNPVSGTRKGIAMFRHRAGLLSESVVKMDLVAGVTAGSGDIEAALDVMKLPQPITGELEYLIDGKAFFNALEKDVKAAETSVDTRVYIFDNDEVAVWYADLLRAKSKGARCRVMMDRLGSISSWWSDPAIGHSKGFAPNASIPHYLHEGESKVQVRTSRNPWLVSDHGKLITIDNKIAYLGGMNIGKEYRYDWHDMMVRVRGDVVSELQWEFDRSWGLQGPLGDWQRPFRRKRKFTQPAVTRPVPMRILRTGVGKIDVEIALLASVRASEKRVYVQNSYFTSKILKDEMVAAAKRGVDVRLVLPSDNDSALLNQANMTVADALIKAGGKVYIYPKFSHVKAVVCDDWSCVGSANLDGLSMRINDEINIAYTDKKLTEELVRDLFQKDFVKSKRLRVKRRKKFWPDVMQMLFRQL